MAGDRKHGRARVSMAGWRRDWPNWSAWYSCPAQPSAPPPEQTHQNAKGRKVMYTVRKRSVCLRQASGGTGRQHEGAGLVLGAEQAGGWMGACI